MLYIYFFTDRHSTSDNISKPFNGCDVAEETRGWLARFPFGRVEIRYL